GEIAGARLYLVEQPHVLDSDDGLVGEGLQQRDLLVGKRPHLRSAKLYRSDRHTLAQQRDTERRTVTQASGINTSIRKLVGRSLKVGDLGRLAIKYRAAADAAARAGHAHPQWLGNRAPMGGGTQLVALELEDRHVIGPAKARRTVNHYV